MLFTATGIKAERIFSYSEDPEKKNPELKAKWLEKRKAGIGGSEIAAVAGINPWKTPLGVFIDKMGLPKEDETNEKMKWGNILEPLVAKEYSERTGDDIVRVNYLLADKDTPYFLTDIDRLIISSKEVPVKEHGNGILEIKTTGWGDNWKEGKIPELPYCQLQWYLGVTGLKWGKLAALVQGQEMVIPEVIWRNEDTINALKELGRRFWTNHILKQEMPTPQSSEDFAYAAERYGLRDEIRKLGQSFELLVHEKMALSTQAKKIEESIERLNGEMLLAMESAKTALAGNTKTMRVQFERMGFKTEKFKEENPELYAKYLKSSQVAYLRHSIVK
jgi:putative phage-type endonuclease